MHNFIGPGRAEPGRAGPGRAGPGPIIKFAGRARVGPAGQGPGLAGQGPARAGPYLHTTDGSYNVCTKYRMQIQKQIKTANK